jgi:hypothetical protein
MGEARTDANTAESRQIKVNQGCINPNCANWLDADEICGDIHQGFTFPVAMTGEFGLFWSDF